MQIKHGAFITLVFASLVTVHGQQPAPAPERPASPSAQSASSVAAADREFFAKVSESGHKEIALARLAAKKGNAPAVKALAERLLKDHTAAGQELAALAQAKGVTLPPPADHTAEMAALEKDGHFDHTYSSMMVDAHKSAIALFERTTRSSDPEVKAFAEKMLPTLREHLKMAEEAAGGPKGTSGTVPASPPAPHTPDTK